MNNSFKFIKYVFYILCIISLFLSIKTKVNADTIDMDYLSSHSTGNRQYNFTSQGGGQVDFTINFDTSNMQVKDYSYIQGNLYVINKTQSKTNASTQNINWVETCSNYGQGGGTNPIQGIITYPDNTSSSIDLTTYNRLCQQWTTTGSVSNSDIQFNFDNSPSIQLMVRTNQNNELPCEVNDTVFKCPIGQYEQLNYIKVRVLPKGTQSDYWVSFSNVIYKFKDSSSVIINNQNTINQSITDTNNTLKDDNVSGNNSSSTISSIGDTFDTENDFLLGLLTIPYNFFNSLINIFENNCTSLNLGSMFDEDLVFPCLSLSNLLGDVFTNVIDVIFCAVVMSAFLRRIVKYYQALLSLDERATQIGGVKIW